MRISKEFLLAALTAFESESELAKIARIDSAIVATLLIPEIGIRRG